METITGFVEHIVFRNEENGYTVLNLAVEEDEVTCVGVFQFISEGESVELKGEYTLLMDRSFRWNPMPSKHHRILCRLNGILAPGQSKESARLWQRGLCEGSRKIPFVL